MWFFEGGFGIFGLLDRMELQFMSKQLNNP
jgi:hypothetical protein